MLKYKNRDFQIGRATRKIRTRAFERNEHGAITPLSVVLILCLIVMGGLFIDMAIANAYSQRQSNMLANARNGMMSTAQALQIKNSDNPGFYAAKTIMTSLRDNGYNGKIWVYYIEAPLNSETSGAYFNDYTVHTANKRAFAWGVQIEEDVPTLLMKFAQVDSMPVWSTLTSYSVPYSGTNTWRPDVAAVERKAADDATYYLNSQINGIYTLKAVEYDSSGRKKYDINAKMSDSDVSKQITYTSLSKLSPSYMDAIKKLPQPLVDEFAAAVTKANSDNSDSR